MYCLHNTYHKIHTIHNSEPVSRMRTDKKAAAAIHALQAHLHDDEIHQLPDHVENQRSSKYPEYASRVCRCCQLCFTKHVAPEMLQGLWHRRIAMREECQAWEEVYEHTVGTPPG